MFIKKTPPSEARRGFSLLELLMVLSLAPVIFFALYSNFSAGLRIWSTVVRPAPEEDVNIFYTKIRRDLENMLRYDAIPLSGAPEEFSFPAAIEAPAGLGGERGIGQVRYAYDPSGNTVQREMRDISQVHRDAPGRGTVLLQKVSSFEFSYLLTDEMGGDPHWDTSCVHKPGRLPLAVRLAFSLEGLEGVQERIIFIPAGGTIE